MKIEIKFKSASGYEYERMRTELDRNYSDEETALVFVEDEEDDDMVGAYYEVNIREVGTDALPYKVSVKFDCKRLRDVMAFQPTAMRFNDSCRPVMFFNDETLVLLMSWWDSDSKSDYCKIEEGDYSWFELSEWLGKKNTAPRRKANGHTVTAQLSFAEQVRVKLLEIMQVKQAA